MVTLIVFASGCAGALGFPSYQSMLPDLVPQEELVGAVGLSSAQWNLGRVIGPALAGLVVSFGGERWGYALAFAINTVSFLAVIVVVWMLRLPGPSGRATGSIIASIREGFSFAWREPGLRTVVSYMGLNSFLAAPFIALVAPMALQVLDSGKGGVSALVTAQGVGAVLMAVSLGTLAARYSSRRVLAGVLWLLPMALIGYACSPNLAVAVVGIFIVGALYLGALSSFTSIAQLRSPPEVRGRVLCVLNVLLGSIYPLGSLVQGWLSDRIGQRATTAGAAFLMLILLAALRVTRPAFLRALDDPVAEHGIVPA
jgi:MFS family permease